jgi:hypothetical protein
LNGLQSTLRHLCNNRAVSEDRIAALDMVEAGGAINSPGVGGMPNTTTPRGLLAWAVTS